MLIIALFGADLGAAQGVPAVYRDEYVTIHAGVAEVGVRPIHIGDAVSFLIRLEFEPNLLRVESLDSDFFQRVFADQHAIKLYAPPTVVERKDNGRITVRASWRFQILGCPANLSNCPGEKRYELPVVPLSYQIIDASGNVVNDKSVRFRPWPGSIAVSPTLANPHGGADSFLDRFPAGAYPEVLSVEHGNGAGIAALIAGLLLVIVGFNGGTSRELRRTAADHTPSPDSRWQRALSNLSDEAMSDERWADLLRRCAAWYCMDELGRNPYTALDTEFDRYFADLLDCDSITAGRRAEFLNRFMRLAGLEKNN